MAVMGRFRFWTIGGEGEEEADHGEQGCFVLSLGIRREREEERNGGEIK